jgi:hydrogenase expression/formation protein HypC
MCLTIPGRVVQVTGAMAEVELEGRTDWYNALAQPDVKVGDYVLTHANLIVSIISEEEAQRMLQAAREMQELIDQEDQEEDGGPQREGGDEGSSTS